MLGLASGKRRGGKPTKQESRETREKSGTNAEFSRHRARLANNESTLGQHGSTLRGHESTLNANAQTLTNYGNALTSHGNTLISQGSSLSSHASNLASLNNTAADHNVRISNAQNKANAADSNAASRILNAAKQINGGHLRDRTVAGINVILGTIGQNELNANTRDEAMTVSSMRTLVYGSALSAAGSNHVHAASRNFKSDYSQEERLRTVEMIEAVEALPDTPWKPREQKAIKDLLLDLAAQLTDDPDERASVWVRRLDDDPGFLHEFRLRWEPLYFLRHKLETDPYYREVHGVPEPVEGAAANEGSRFEKAVERTLREVAQRNERGHVHEAHDPRAIRREEDEGGERGN